VLHYLEKEHHAKHHESPPFDSTEWKCISKVEHIPQQQNFVDCGVYMCLFVNILMEYAMMTKGDDILSVRFPFNDEDTSRIRVQMKLDLLNRCIFPSTLPLFEEIELLN